VLLPGPVVGSSPVAPVVAVIGPVVGSSPVLVVGGRWSCVRWSAGRRVGGVAGGARRLDAAAVDAAPLLARRG
jgi:hypothetical protein